MNTVQFLQTLNDSADRCGLLNADGSVANTHAGFLARCIERRLRQAWRWFDWPELTRVDQRAFRPVFSLGDSYALGDEVYDEESNAYYTAQRDGFSGHPVDDTDFWLPITDGFDKFIALNQPGYDPIGEVLGVTRKDPATNREPDRIPFTLSAEGVQFGIAPPTAWLRYRLPAPKFTTAPWSAGTYPAKTLRFYTPTGECYQALRSTASLPTNDADWQFQGIPERFHDFIVAAAYADFLRDDGQEDKAVSGEDGAMQILEEERDQITKQQGQGQRYKVRVR